VGELLSSKIIFSSSKLATLHLWCDSVDEVHEERRNQVLSFWYMAVIVHNRTGIMLWADYVVRPATG